MLGEGIVTLGTPFRTTDFRWLKDSPKITVFSDSGSATCRPAGVQRMSPFSLWNSTSMFCFTFSTPPMA